MSGRKKAYEIALHELVRYAAAPGTLAGTLLEHGVLEGDAVTAILDDAIRETGSAEQSCLGERSG
ncbi:hypothetical protein F9K94_14370 [Brucella tritici]|uniref:Uncharacterized protein n=1 Tax=Brucella tritici TaxID=94626 RepID=A0A7V8B2V7_9HYPH|nr:hypothetical protein [Brucella tritici]KAB2657535.1 hypothetical protein F9K94_14370 [Brucella tritici]